MSRVLEDEVGHLSGGAPAHEPDQSAEGDRPSGRLLSLCLWGSGIGFVAVGIGWPLVGSGVFGPTDLLALWSPYGEDVLAGVTPANRFLQDVADGVIPQTALFAELLGEGAGAWNPYLLGGVPLGAVPNNGVFNPLSLPYLVLPAWFAPAWVKATEIGVAVGGTFLFARRLGLGRPAAAVGGLAFATSAFLLAWTGWPQTRTAALVPLLFWAVERLAARRRVGDAALVSLAAAAMLLGGFPAVTGYALVAAAGYFLVRVFALYPGHRRRIAGVCAGGVAAVAGAVGLAAFQLLPFQYFLSHAYVWGREQGPADHLPFQSLLTAVAPWALGTTHPGGEPVFVPGTNLVEALSYVGAASLLLAIVAVAGVRAARALLPRGVWTFLVAGCLVLVVLVYAGGVPLALAQRLPVLFADNFVGRARSVLGFLVAVLVAVGFEVVARRRAGVRAGHRWWGAGVWVAAAAGAVVVWLAGRSLAAGDPGRLAHLDREVLVGCAFLAVAAGCVGLAWWGRWRTLALAAVPVLVVAQALTFALPYWARSDRGTFYPETATHRFLAENLGADRYANAPDTLMAGESSVHRLRSLNGHTFSHRRLGELVEALPGVQYHDPPSLPATAPSAAVVTSPVLDRLAVRYFVAAPDAAVLGTAHPLTTAGAPAVLPAGVPVTAPVQRAGPLRALVLRVAEPVRARTRLTVSLRDQAGTEVARGGRVLAPTGWPLAVHVPLTGEDVPAGTPLTATLTADAALPLAALAGVPALTTIGPADDGLRLAAAGDTVVYERVRVLPRIRWAAGSVAEPDPARRLAMLAGGELGRDEVLLDRRSGASAGAPATVEVVEDGTDAVEVVVTAGGGGHLVVADALQHGWSVTVDGEPAELLAADHALVAVALGEGTHTVRLTYTTPYHGAGTWLSAATGTILCALVALTRWRSRQGRTTNAEVHPRNLED